MNCPLCQTPLSIDASDVYKDHPTYKCPIQVSGDEYTHSTHYIKYFSADWTYSHYREEAVLPPYRLINYYNFRQGKSDYSAIQEYKFVKHAIQKNGQVKRFPCFDRYKFQTLMRFDQCLSIPDSEHFVNRIKTLLVFS